MDALLTPERLSLVGLLAIVIIGFIRGTIVTAREHEKLQQRCNEETERADLWERRFLETIPIMRQATANADRAIEVAKTTLDVAKQRTEPGGGPP